ncbi:MAG: MMPL family transporter, partial [Spirochaetaceae bacterium]|nr:MMPL family transporter [Spirochaetaceae bacterium]
MKNNFLQSNYQKRSQFIWIFFHVILLLAVFIRGSFSVNTNLFDILPPSHSMQAVAEADKIVSEKNSRNVIILASHEDFSVAKNAIEELYVTFKDNPAFESIELYFDTTIVNQISDYIFTNRYSLLNQKTRNLLHNGQGEILANQALSIIYSPFTLTGLKYFNQDPFMLTESQFQDFLSSSLAGSTAMSPKEDILCTYQEGKWYTMLQGKLTKEATSITEKEGVISALKAFSHQKEKTIPDLDFIISGVPFHSFESSTNAQREISLISTISLIIVFIVLIFIFKSIVPVIVSMGCIIISSVIAVAAVLLFFGEMHIMTLVFGTTLIGLGVDYSIHFFIAQTKGSAKNGHEALSSIFKGLTFGFISTQI